MITKYYREILAAEVKLAFCLPDEAHNVVYKRDEACRELVQACRNQAGGLTEQGYQYLGSALLFLSGGLGEAPGLVALPVLSQELCEALASREADIHAFHARQGLEVAAAIIERAREPQWQHAQRRQALEAVIKDLQQRSAICPPDLQDRLRLLLAQAYLERSRIIRPKGFTISPKKKEALDKALEQLDQVTDTGKTTLDYHRFRGDIFLELGRLEARTGKEIEACLAEAILFLDPRTPANLTPVDCRLIVAYARLARDPSYLPLVLGSSKATALDRAWAAYLSNNASGAAKEINTVLQDLQRRWFSHPDWEGLVDLLVDWARSSQKGWEDLATAAWQVCQKNEQELRYSGCQLRWYWSRHQDLYDLAFQAAPTLEEKARVADSLKSRPLVRLALAEQLAQAQAKKKRGADVDFAQLIEQDARAYANQYIAGGLAAGSASAPVAPLSFTELPDEQWLAVHFYLSSGAAAGLKKNMAYALVYDAKDQKWSCEGPYETTDLWQAYRRWQDNYAAVSQASAPELESLCRQIGTTFPFLWALPSERPVVFIPHGFLHRLPLHMALREDGATLEVWAATHPSTYLPAWSLRPRADAGGSQNVAAVYLPDELHDAEDFQNILAGQSFAAAASWPVFRKQAGQARRLALVCHGLAHAVNPFAARLLLPEEPQLVDFLTDLPALPGSQVFLAACEADMAPAQEAPLDEHLSLATAFLQKGAREVLGGVFEVNKYLANELLSSFGATSAAACYSLLWKWQQARLDNFLDNPDPLNLYWLAPWRVLGLS